MDDRPLSLTAWLDSPSTETGVRVLAGDSWLFHSYDELARRVGGAARQLEEAGVEPEDVVAIVDDGCLEFLSAFFATLCAGATPLPLPPAHRLGERYDEHVTAVLRRSSARFAVGGPPAFEDAPVRHVQLVDDSSSTVTLRAPAEIALLQYTSGSTSAPRGVRVSPRNLETNLGAIRDWLGWTSHDAAASWLPLHHDMGLIGQLLMSVCTQTNLWQMQPEQFLLAPLRWLECFGGTGATVTAAPSFGYAYVARRVSKDQLAGLDFAGWHNAVIGAERIMPAGIAAFARLVATRGFRTATLRPAYGLAEATLAVTGHPSGSEPRMVKLDWHALQAGSRVRVLGSRAVSDGSRAESQGYVITCGRPLDGISIAVVNDDGEALPEGTLGEIVVAGPSVASGYDQGEGPTSTRFANGSLITGDAGYMLDGELFVLGRIADSLKVRGRPVYAESLEIVLASALELPTSKCAVVASHEAGSEAVTAIVEANPGEWADCALQALRIEVGPSVNITVYATGPRSIPRTTSGKPRRRELSRRLHAGELAVELVARAARPDVIGPAA